MTQVWEIARSTLQKLLSIRAAQYFIVFGALLEKGRGEGGSVDMREEHRDELRGIVGNILRGPTGGGDVNTTQKSHEAGGLFPKREKKNYLFV